MTVDEILATGRYNARDGQIWLRDMFKHDGWIGWFSRGGSDVPRVTDAQMRLLTERDQHRDVCPGLIDCDNHPAPSVLLTKGGELEFLVFGPRQVRSIRAFDYHSEAMDAARALAVSE